MDLAAAPLFPTRPGCSIIEAVPGTMYQGTECKVLGRKGNGTGDVRGKYKDCGINLILSLLYFSVMKWLKAR